MSRLRIGGNGIVALVCASLLAGCWRNEREYPYLHDARTAFAAKDPARAEQAARVVLDHQRILESPEDELREATRIADESHAILEERRLAFARSGAERRLEEARGLPRDKAGLSGRYALLRAVIEDRELEAYHAAARRELEEVAAPMWEQLTPLVTKDNYETAEKVSFLFVDRPKSLDARITAVKLEQARVHERAADASVDGLLGTAQRWWHLRRASELGAKHDVRSFEATLSDAFRVGYILAGYGADARCTDARSRVERSVARSGTLPVTVEVKASCSSDRSVTSGAGEHTEYETRVTVRQVLQRVQTGTRTECTTAPATQECGTRVESTYGGRERDPTNCWTKPGERTCKEIPEYGMETVDEEVEETIPHVFNYTINRKSKSAKVSLTARVTVGGRVHTETFGGSESFHDEETSGNAGSKASRFGSEPSDTSMIDSAMAEALGKLTAYVHRFESARREVLLDELQRQVTEDPAREEGLHATVLWLSGASSTTSSRHAKAMEWFGERWAQRPDRGELGRAVDDLSLETSGTPLETLPPPPPYVYDAPTPVGYLNVAHGAGWLVSRGASFDAVVRQSNVDASASQMQLAASFTPIADQVNAFRLSASGGSTAIIGDTSSYAFGLAVARSLRGKVSDHHRVELVAELGVSAGANELDGVIRRTPPSTPTKDHFVAVPISLTASVPFYAVAMQGRLTFAPNVLSSTNGWESFHPLSAWFGILPFGRLIVEGGAEVPFGASSSAPRFGGRLGVRL